jgi:hypothetical protein
MNIFNRIVVILVLLAIGVASFIAIINEFSASFKWSDVSLRLFNPGGNTPTYISVIALLAIIAVCVLLLVLELRRKKGKIARVNNVQSGKGMITLDTVSQQVKSSVLRIEGIKNLKVNILPKSGGVIIDMVTELGQNQNISEKMTEIIKTAKESAEKLNIRVYDAKLTVSNLIPDEKGNLHYRTAAPEKAVQTVVSRPAAQEAPEAVISAENTEETEESGTGSEKTPDIPGEADSDGKDNS